MGCNCQKNDASTVYFPNQSTNTVKTNYAVWHMSDLRDCPPDQMFSSLQAAHNFLREQNNPALNIYPVY